MAILIVMISHAGLNGIIPGGFGVNVFFFLSGYLITTLMRLEHARSGRLDLLAFYGRRAARILPALYLTVVLTLALIAIDALPARFSPAGTAIDLLFLTNYASVLGVSTSSPIPLWSLDIEEHFYMFFPLVFLALSRFRRKAAPTILFAVCLAILGVRIVTFLSDGPSEIYYWSHTRVDSIVWGTILAMWQNPALDREAWRPGPAAVAAAAATILLTFAIRDPFFRDTARYTLQGGALFVLFSAAIQSRGGAVRRLLDARILKTIALLSYTLYLVHAPMLELCIGLGLPFAIPIAYLLAVGWAWLLYVVVERPIARWRKRSLAAHLKGDGSVSVGEGLPPDHGKSPEPPFAVVGEGSTR